VAEPLFEEILILREQRDSLQTVQQRNDLQILNSKTGNVASDLPVGHSRLAQQRCLISREVLDSAA